MSSKSEHRPPLNALLAVVICTLSSSYRMGYNMSMFNPSFDALNASMYRTMKAHYQAENISQVGADFLWSSTVSIMFLFATFGAITFTFCSGNLGRRTVLLISQVIFIFGSLVSSFAYFDLYELLIFGQSLIGFALGFSCSALTPYIDEISDSSYAHFLYTLIAISIELGTSSANFLGIDVILGGEHLWPILVLFPAIFNVVCIIFLLKTDKETPARLLKMNKKLEALQSVQFYFQIGPDGAEVKLLQIEREMLETGSRDQKGICQALTELTNRKAWLLCVMTSAAANFSGILAITIFGTSLMSKYGRFNNTLNGFVNLGVFTASLIGLVISLFAFNKIPHRVILLIGIPLMLIINVCFMIVMLTMEGPWALALIGLLIVLFCLAFSNSVEKVVWFNGALYTRPEFMDANSSITVFATYFTAFLAPLIYYPISGRFEAYSFFLFIGLLIILWFVFYIWYPSIKVTPISESIVSAMEVDRVGSIKEGNGSVGWSV